MEVYGPFFEWDYGSKEMWVDVGDLSLLRANGREWLFGDTDAEKAATRLWGGVLAMFFDSTGYFKYWWNSPSRNPGNNGWSIFDNMLYVPNPPQWKRLPKRIECMTSIKIWATRMMMYGTIKGAILRDSYYSNNIFPSVEQMAFRAVARSSPPLNMHMGIRWPRNSKNPVDNSDGPKPWTEVEKIYK